MKIWNMHPEERITQCQNPEDFPILYCHAGKVLQDSMGKYYYVELDLKRFVGSKGGVSVKSCIWPLPLKVGWLLSAFQYLLQTNEKLGFFR